MRPGLIVNCAAYTDVDGAESHAASGARGQWSRRSRTRQRRGGVLPCHVVHYSTDFVFDGEAHAPVPPRTTSRIREASMGCPNCWVSGLPLNTAAVPTFAKAPVGKPSPERRAPSPESPVWILRVESLFGEVAPGAVEKGSVPGIVRRDH